MEENNYITEKYRLRPISAIEEDLPEMTEYLVIEGLQTYRLTHNTSLIIIHDEEFSMYRLYEDLNANNIELEKALAAYIKERLLRFPPKIRAQILP
ncbi:hypothetical protein [Flavobacterium sp. SORGH_AS_0622]|uniref:hypothetical protein n=1 Tax=Flavobacterium sp. SORGH_AS_0622 TaxID=3041772 RepID=UPI002787D50D|nr:hypothetical protein [Flavobacterium sp. SORGH_AS_0622]MDQ1165880.1 hypothetical protein [Flavobacterium sp. SORGH_AS_0622]